MLKLPVPEAEYENVVLKPSEFQKEMVASLAERAEAVRDRQVQPYEDNMLKITNDGRKLALDQRLLNDMLPDEENSKAATCVEKAYEIWENTKEQKSAQLILFDTVLNCTRRRRTGNRHLGATAFRLSKTVP